MIGRIFRHWFEPAVIKRLDGPALARIAEAVTAVERQHGIEIRIVLEHRLDFDAVVARTTARERAEQLFALERIWDTDMRNGVLIYVLLADHALEIVADRGASRSELFDSAAIADRLSAAFHQREFERGILEAVAQIAHSGAGGVDAINALPDAPLIL